MDEDRSRKRRRMTARDDAALWFYVPSENVLSRCRMDTLAVRRLTDAQRTPGGLGSARVERRKKDHTEEHFLAFPEGDGLPQRGAWYEEIASTIFHSPLTLSNTLLNKEAKEIYWWSFYQKQYCRRK
jgi:hypothetical protein